MARVGERGGIRALLDLLDQHRGALRYDFRARFGCSLDVVGESMPWDEALDLVRILRGDPSSMLAAAAEGWDYPVPRSDAILMDHFDLTYKAAGAKKPFRYPRPFGQVAETRTRGNAAGRTPEQVKAILREQFGHPEQPI